MRHIRTLTQALIGATILAGGLAALTPAAQASTPVACSETALVDAVNHANSIGGDTLALASGCIYGMTASHGSAGNGPDALPVITTRIEMIGPATITRTSGSFRIAEVSSTGSLTLTTGVALTNGSASTDGGGILNHGAVTLTGSSLSGNTATGNGGGLANADTPSGTAPAATFTRSPVSNNTAGTNGGGIYNGQRGTLTTTGVSGSPLNITGNTATGTLLGLFGGGRGGGIAAVNSTATTLTQTAVTNNHAGGLLGLGGTAGGVYRLNGTMTTTNSPITANTPNNCVGSAPAVPNCTG
jgi:predicted outer membrane repeat protein